MSCAKVVSIFLLPLSQPSRSQPLSLSLFLQLLLEKQAGLSKSLKRFSDGTRFQDGAGIGSDCTRGTKRGMG